jgi:5-oxoprolinase (ATP-hydrolysing)
VRADGRIEELGHIGKTEMGAGDQFVIETPGGGGYAPAVQEAPAAVAAATVAAIHDGILT